jgi:glycosyltransferase involved in cell wall biosynthesis
VNGAVSERVLVVAPAPPPYGGMALQARQLEKLLRADGIAVSLFPSNFALPGWLKFLEGLPGVRTVARALVIWPKLWAGTRQTDVVHVLAASWAYFFLVVYPAVLVGRICGKKVVLNYRGGEAARFFQWFGWAASPAFRLAGVITAPSEFLAEVIHRRFGASVSIVPNILDSRAFRFRRRTSIQPKLLVTRHLEPAYDIESVLRAFRRVREVYPEASLWIAGTGSQEQYLRGLVSDWNLENVRFLGNIAHSDLPDIYDQCDIYLNASRIDNFPGALIEASAAGLVVVSTDAGGIPFIYQHEKTALLVKTGDWQELALAAQKVLQTSTLALDLVTAARALAQACDWREVRKSLYRAYGFPSPTAFSELDPGGGISCESL